MDVKNLNRIETLLREKDERLNVQQLKYQSAFTNAICRNINRELHSGWFLVFVPDRKPVIHLNVERQVLQGGTGREQRASDRQSQPQKFQLYHDGPSEKFYVEPFILQARPSLPSSISWIPMTQNYRSDDQPELTHTPYFGEKALEATLPTQFTYVLCIMWEPGCCYSLIRWGLGSYETRAIWIVNMKWLS